jgi:hypothetical protein
MLIRLLDKFMATKYWRWLASRVVGHLSFRLWGYPKLDIVEAYDYITRLFWDENTVYAFVTSDRKSLAGLLVKAVTGSWWMHAGLLFNIRTVYEMKSNGLNKTHILNLLKEVDDFAIIKYQAPNAEVDQRVLQLHASGNVQYDFLQKLNNGNHIYCSELISLLLKDLVPLKYSNVHGRDVFSPFDVFKNGEVVYYYDSKQRKRIV